MMSCLGSYKSLFYVLCFNESCNDSFNALYLDALSFGCCLLNALSFECFVFWMLYVSDTLSFQFFMFQMFVFSILYVSDITTQTQSS